MAPVLRSDVTWAVYQSVEYKWVRAAITCPRGDISGFKKSVDLTVRFYFCPVIVSIVSF